MLKNSLLVVAAIVATFFLFYGGFDNQQAMRSVKELWNLGHVFYFAVLTYLFNQWSWFDKKHWLYRWLLSLSLAAVIGLTIEILQYGTQRDPDLADISRDITGCLLVLAFHPAYLKFTRTYYTIVTRSIVGIIFMLHLMPITVAVVDESIARKQFPVLSNFETPFELDRWYGEATQKVLEDPELGGYQLEISLSTALYSGVGMQYLPADWTGYQSLHLRLYQPLEDPLNMTIRIHDRHHNNQFNDRFNRGYQLKKGWNEIEVDLLEVAKAPLKRKMDLTQIRNVMFFSISLPEPRKIYLDKIYLSR